MGLSSDERVSGMIYAVNGIHEAGEAIATILVKNGHAIADNCDNPHCQCIVDLCRDMWHGVLGDTTNGSHWLLGSSSSNRLSGRDNSPWAIALRNHWEDEQQRKEDKQIEDFADRTYDVLGDHLSIEQLLYDDNDNSLQLVYRVYSWCEQLIYYLRRYNDKLRSDFGKLDKMLSLLMGHCFAIFSRNQEYAKAYLMSDISSILYGPGFPWNKKTRDIVTDWMVRDNSHHNIRSRISSISLAELAKLHKSLIRLNITQKQQKAGKDNRITIKSKLSVEDELKVQRMLVMLELTGEKLTEYEHVLKDFWAKVDADALMSQKDVKARIKEVIERCKKALSDTKNKREQAYESDSAYDERSFYGPFGLD